MSRLVACRVLIAASICDKLSIVRSTRSICTRCCLKMIDMIQVCSHFQSARVFIINTLPDEIEFSHSFTFFLWCFSHSFTLFRFQSLFHALSLGGDSLRAGPRKPSALSLSLSRSLSRSVSLTLSFTRTPRLPLSLSFQAPTLSLLRSITVSLFPTLSHTKCLCSRFANINSHTNPSTHDSY